MSSNVELVLQCPGRLLTQRELRNKRGEIMSALDRGKRFVVTRRTDLDAFADQDPTPRA